MKSLEFAESPRETLKELWRVLAPGGRAQYLRITPPTRLVAPGRRSFVVGALGFMLEARAGNRFDQGWQFYAVTFSLFIVLAFPGFTYQYLVKRR